MLCDGAKLTGILIEGESIGEVLVVAVGIGVNCAHHPPPANHPTTDLATAGVYVSPEGLFTALSGTMAATARAMATRRRLHLDSRRLARAGDRDRRRACWCGCPSGEFSGRGEALDERGRLLLRLADGSLRDGLRRRRIPARQRAGRPAPATGRGRLMARDELVFASLGGIGEIGMNLSIYGVGEERRR